MDETLKFEKCEVEVNLEQTRTTIVQLYNPCLAGRFLRRKPDKTASAQAMY